MLKECGTAENLQVAISWYAEQEPPQTGLKVQHTNKEWTEDPTKGV